MEKNRQLTHEEVDRRNKKFPLSIIASNIHSPLNTGSLFRLCDALGIKKLYLCGDTLAPPNAKINKTSRSTEKYVDYESFADAESLVADLKQAGCYIISLEITASSLAIDSDDFSASVAAKLAGNKEVCLILGEENGGVSDSLLALSDMSVHIPMHGQNSSMNVVSAASIACFEIIRIKQMDSG